MTDTQIQRINVLAKKAKTQGLTEQETAEQAELRRLYRESFVRNLRGQLDCIELVDGQKK